jgi:hypothetical protein
MLAGVAVDLLVGEFDRLLHPKGEAVGGGVVVGDPGCREVVVDQVGGHGTGELARGGAAHPVGHHEEGSARSDLVSADLGMQARVPGAEVGDQERILVVLPGPPEIGLTKDGHLDRERHARGFLPMIHSVT